MCSLTEGDEWRALAVRGSFGLWFAVPRTGFGKFRLPVEKFWFHSFIATSVLDNLEVFLFQCNTYVEWNHNQNTFDSNDLLQVYLGYLGLLTNLEVASGQNAEDGCNSGCIAQTWCNLDYNQGILDYNQGIP